MSDLAVPLLRCKKYLWMKFTGMALLMATVCKTVLYRVERMVEKPTAADAPSNLAIIGRYILTPDIFDIIRSTPPGGQR